MNFHRVFCLLIFGICGCGSPIPSFKMESFTIKNTNIRDGLIYMKDTHTPIRHGIMVGSNFTPEGIFTFLRAEIEKGKIINAQVRSPRKKDRWHDAVNNGNGFIITELEPENLTVFSVMSGRLRNKHKRSNDLSFWDLTGNDDNDRKTISLRDFEKPSSRRKTKKFSDENHSKPKTFLPNNVEQFTSFKSSTTITVVDTNNEFVIFNTGGVNPVKVGDELFIYGMQGNRLCKAVITRIRDGNCYGVIHSNLNTKLSSPRHTSSASAGNFTGVQVGSIASYDPEFGFYFINRGYGEGIKVGDEFDVLRGEVLVGRIKIIRTKSTVSVAQAIKRLTPRQLQTGDRVIKLN